MKRKPNTMSPADRAKLLAVPITFNLIAPRKSIGGTCVADEECRMRLHTPGTFIWNQMFRRSED